VTTGRTPSIASACRAHDGFLVYARGAAGGVRRDRGAVRRSRGGFQGPTRTLPGAQVGPRKRTDPANPLALSRIVPIARIPAD
jgi:hypothetical protein